MKKLLTALVIAVYLAPLSLFLTVFVLLSRGESDSPGLSLFIIPLIMMFIVCALVAANMVGAIICAISSKRLSFRTVMVFKLCLIPFYIVNFICWGFSMLVFHIALIIGPLIPFIIAYTYFTVVGTSAHNLANLLNLRQNQKISTRQCAVHIILQLIFVADVIDSIYLALKQTKD